MYLKNTASQKLEVFAWDYSTGAPKTGDAANLTAYVNIDDAGYNALADTSATEVDSTNKKGWYVFDLSQAETNGTKLAFTAKSSTANVNVMPSPRASFTQPATGFLAPATAGRTVVVDAAGLVDANTVKLGPSGSGTAQTARDVGNALPAAPAVAAIGALADGAITAAKIAADAIGSSQLAASAVSEIWASVADSAGVTTLLSRLGTPSNLGSGASVAANLADIEGFADDIPSLATADKLLGYVQLLARSDIGLATDRATELDEINADEGSGAGNYFPFQEALQNLQGIGGNVSAILDDTGSTGVVLATDSVNSNAVAASAVSEIQSGLSTLTQANVRTAVGLASANLDTQLSGIPAAVLASTIETGVSFLQTLRAIGAAAAGKRSNSNTSSEQYDAIGNPGTARIIPNADAAGDGTPTLSL